MHMVFLYRVFEVSCLGIRPPPPGPASSAGLGFRVSGFGVYRFWGLGFGVQGLGWAVGEF